MSVSYGGSSITFEDGSIVSSGSAGFKNKIINGGMVINQRGYSATPTADATYTLDRWKVRLTQASKFSVAQGSATGNALAAGFNNCLTVTSASAYSVLTGDYFGIQQDIEGYNIADLQWGTASGKTITLSFWVNSSLTGSFGGFLANATPNQFYPFTYTISSANTWEQKSITIPASVTGTWNSTNNNGLQLEFSLGAGATYTGTGSAWTSSAILQPTGSTSVVGTSGATWSVTGVQFEKGTTASTFEFRSYGKELMLCQRYYEVLYNDTATVGVWGHAGGEGGGRGNWFWHVAKRAQATVALASGTSWVANTPQIFPGIDKAHFYSASGYFYSSNTAGTPSLTATAEL